MDASIITLTRASTRPISEYSFLAIGYISLAENDFNQSVMCGAVKYCNPIFEFYFAIRYENWIFCVEKNKMTNKISLAAFYKDAHYTFYVFPDNTPLEDTRKQLFAFFMTTVLPHIDPTISLQGNLQVRLRDFPSVHLYSPEELHCKHKNPNISSNAAAGAA